MLLLLTVEESGDSSVEAYRFEIQEFEKVK